MKRYKLLEDSVFDNLSSHSIPDVPSNRHWQEYQEWLAEGNTPIPIRPSEHHNLINDKWVLNGAAKKKADWAAEMAGLDAEVTPRMLEDVIDFITGVTTELPNNVKQLMAARKSKRNQNPGI